MITRTAQLLTALLFIAASLLVACSNNPEPSTASASPTPTVPVYTSPAPPTYEGFHDAANCTGLVGWAWDASRPDEPIKVDVYDGDRLLTTLTADEFRQDLLNSKKGNGRHNFSYPLPAQLKDGKPHSIRVRFAGTNTDLGNTPKEITCNAQ